jgi:hypothetical protein
MLQNTSNGLAADDRGSDINALSAFIRAHLRLIASVFPRAAKTPISEKTG